MFNVADFAPVELGVKTTDIVHNHPASSVGVHVFVCEKFAAFVPVNVNAGDPMKVNNAVPVFSTSTACGADGIPEVTLPKLNDVGTGFTVGVPDPPAGAQYAKCPAVLPMHNAYPGPPGNPGRV
jgi:hypothetical protein